MINRMSTILRLVALCVLVVLGVVGAGWALYALPSLLVAEDLENRADLIVEERRTVLAIGAAIIAALTLFYTHRRQRLTEDENRTTRYTQAVEQLGHADDAVRLGGIYALERLAKDSPNDRGTISKVLSAFVRRDGRAASAERGPASVDVEAAVQVLARNRWPHANSEIDLTGADLRGMNLTGVNLPGVSLDLANLRGAILVAARLDGASLSAASLNGATLDEASLSSTKLSDSDLTEAQLDRANLAGADLRGTGLHRAILRDADLTGADLTFADLRGGADLTGANLQDANLTETRISRAVFAQARGTSEEQWSKCRQVDDVDGEATQ